MEDWKSAAIELRRKGLTYRQIHEELPEIPEGTINTFLASLKNPKTETSKEELTIEQLLEKESTRELEKHQCKLTKEDIKRAAHINILADLLVCAKNAEPKQEIRMIKLPESKKSNRTIPVLDFSDVQCGTEISLAATGGLNSYNKDVLTVQMEKLVNGIVSISTKQLSEYPLLKIHMLGDMLEGFGIFPGQAYHMDMDVCQQFFYLAELTSKLLKELLQLYDKIEICCVPGNHGRIGKKGEAPHYLNWDYFWYKYMETKMQNYTRITWDITEAWYMLDTTHSTTSLLLHGEGIKSWQGIPFYGIQRADARYTKLMSAHNRSYHMIEMGHFHTPAEIPTPTGPIIINGCFPGASMFALKDLNTSNRPQQKMFGIHKEHGLTWSFPVYLD